MTYTSLILIFLLLFIIELIYFRVADMFNIIDKPNHRSSHSSVTLRGGGIIFAISLFLYPVIFGCDYLWFLLGLLAITTISFLDDVSPVSNKLRIAFHLIAVALMFTQLHLFDLPLYLIILALVLVIGTINAINFMDGINGITGSYALITLLSLFYINSYCISFTIPAFLIMAILSVLVFMFFNFRKSAVCFAGDVGSVGIAFIILFFLLQLIVKTNNFNYLLLLLLYGLDTVTTIIFRLLRRENIFDAHRSHFYQYWANERKYPHLVISVIYSVLQLLINSLIIFWLPESIVFAVTGILLSTILFIALRFSTEGSAKLLGH